ncbi:MAG: MFS transporter [Sulfobacillus sp.]
MPDGSPQRPWRRAAGWTELDVVARRLISARFLRAIGQGALAVDFTLYLRALHWGAVAIGLLLMAGALCGAGLSLIVGLGSDRIGRRAFLCAYEGGLILGLVALLVAPSTGVLIVVAAVFGFGRGANGASGPFAPAEQAWLAQVVSEGRRGRIFSLQSGLQFWGMAIGSVLAAVLIHLIPGNQGAVEFLPIFYLNLGLAAVNLIQIVTLRELRLHGPTPAHESSSVEQAEQHRVLGSENRALALLATVNMVNALGIGMVAPLLPYWFSVRFGVGPDLIGPVYALTFVLTGASTMAAGWLAERIGIIRSIVWPRFVGVVLLVAIPLMPSFTWAAVAYVVRSVVNRSSVGVRQAFGVSLVRDHRRGFASSLNTISQTVPAAVGPAIGGLLIAAGALAWPFLIAAGLQLGYVLLFPRLLGPYEPARMTAGEP